MTRLLLDAHLSGRAIGGALRDIGHDVHAIDAEKDLEGLKDEDVLDLAISEGQDLVVTPTTQPRPTLASRERAPHEQGGLGGFEVHVLPTERK